MPKIIKDLDKKIYSSAFNLFLTKGYGCVDMKSIAKDIGIAVGTLYNYYPNKNKLFKEVLHRSWDETFARLDAALDDSTTDSKDRLKISIRIIYEDIESRNGLGREVMNSHDLTHDEMMNEFKNMLYDRFISSVMSIGNMTLDYDIRNRLVETLMVIIPVMISEHSKEKEKNITFIDMLIDGLLTNEE